MIWAALATAIAIAIGARKSGSLLTQWLEQMRKLLRKHVDAPARRELALALVEDEKQVLETYFEEVQVILDELYLTHSKYDAAFADYEPGVAALCEAFAEVQRSQLTAALELRSILEPQELQAVGDAVDERLDKYWARRHKRDAKAAKSGA